MSQTSGTDHSSKVFEQRGLGNQEERVEAIKFAATQLLSQIGEVLTDGNPDAGRCLSIAKTKLEESVMWAVKGVSRATTKN